MVGRIIVDGVLTYCKLLHFQWDLKATQMNVLHSLIWKFMLYEFELDYFAGEAAKNICCTEGKGIINRWWFKKFCSSCKNLNYHASSGRSKIMDSKAILLATYLVSSPRRVAGKFGISHSNVICHLHDLSKRIQSCQIMSHVTKILWNFLLTLVFTQLVGHEPNVAWGHFSSGVQLVWIQSFLSFWLDT